MDFESWEAALRMLKPWRPNLVVDHPVFPEQPSLQAFQEFFSAWVVRIHWLVEVVMNSNDGDKFLLVE